MTIKIILVDDHHVIRKGLALLLNSYTEMNVVGEGTNGKEAIELSQKYSPDIIIMDLLMPVMDGIEATKQIREKMPQAHLVFIEPPSIEELERRLRERGTEDEETVARRMKAAEVELSRKEEYDIRLVNDDLDAATAELVQYVNDRAGL